MEIIDSIVSVIEKLNEIDNYIDSLTNKQSMLDEKTQDLLHYIENNKVSTFGCYRLIKELKEIRIERRKVKEDLELGRKYNEIKNRLASLENRSFIISELRKKEKQLQTSYNNRQYSEEELKQLIEEGRKTNNEKK